MEVGLYISESDNIYYNLAAEEWLLSQCGESCIFMILFVNSPCVVAGRNQNLLNECNFEYMKKHSILPARRQSGGGCVYHDKGNLNFSFIGDKKLMSIERNFNIVLSALKKMGITASLSGRNDILVADKKISGNAFLYTENRILHHGTMLIDSDLNVMDCILKPDARKRILHGIMSSRQRVINLCDIKEDINILRMKMALTEEFSSEYGNYIPVTPKKDDKFQALVEHQRDDSWIWGSAPNHSFKIEAIYRWGSVNISVKIEQGIIVDIITETDALDAKLPIEIRNVLKDIKIWQISEKTTDNPQIEDIIKTITKYYFGNDYEN